jgi:hypothetical protein
MLTEGSTPSMEVPEKFRPFKNILVVHYILSISSSRIAIFPDGED